MKRRDVLEVLQDLPLLCFSRLPTTNEPIIIQRGVVGYYPTSPLRDVDRLNAEMGVTARQLAAMEAGSMFGWDCPGADPLNPIYDRLEGRAA